MSNEGFPELIPIASLTEHEVRSWQDLASTAIQPNPYFEPEFVRAATKDLDQAPRSLAVVRDGSRWYAAMPATKVGFGRLSTLVFSPGARTAPGPTAPPMTPIARIVRLDGRAIGSYIYLPRQRAPARVLHLSARGPEAVTEVMGDFLRDATGRGIASVCGRAEPHLHRALRDRYAAVGYGLQPVVHCRDPELSSVLASRQALLTEFDSVDSEWWGDSEPGAMQARS